MEKGIRAVRDIGFFTGANSISGEVSDTKAAVLTATTKCIVTSIILCNKDTDTTVEIARVPSGETDGDEWNIIHDASVVANNTITLSCEVVLDAGDKLTMGAADDEHVNYCITYLQL